jgi:hypothetical protein
VSKAGTIGAQARLTADELVALAIALDMALDRVRSLALE